MRVAHAPGGNIAVHPMMPVTRGRLTLAARHTLGVPAPGAAGVAAHQFDAQRTVARQHLRRGVAETAAIGRLHHGRAGGHRADEGLAGRGLAAVVGHQQHLAAQRQRQAIHQRRFLRRLDVAGQQQAAPALALHAQHAAQRVRRRRRQVVAGLRVQQLEVHAVPVPGLPGGTAPVRHAGCPQRVRLGQRTGHRRHRQLGQQRRRAAHMVDIAVAQHQQVDAAFASRAQQRQQHALRGVGLQRIARPAVVEQQVAAGAQQYRRALADVGSDHLELALGRPRQRRRQQRQQQRQAERAQAPRQRHHQQRTAEQAHRHGPAGCCRGRPQAEGPAGQPVQHPHQRAHQRAGQRPQWRPQDAGQRQRHDRQRDQRDGQQVGDEADQRHLLEEHQAQRRQADTGQHLGAQPALQGPGQPAYAARGQRRRARSWLGHHQQRHRHEGQPEARLHHRPGVEQRDHAGGGQQHQRRRPVQTGTAQQRHRGQHPQRALRRHAPAGQQRIAGRGQHPAPACSGRRGQRQHQPRAQTPQRSDQRRGEPGEQRHVQAADAHQVGHAGVAEQLPVLALDGRLVAHRQRRQHAGGACIGHAQQDRVAHRLARSVHRVAGGIGQQTVDRAGRWRAPCRWRDGPARTSTAPGRNHAG